MRNLKTIRALLFCVAVCVFCASAYSQSPILAPRVENVLIENPLGPDPVRELLPVVVDGKCGFIDRKGEIVIKPQFDRCADFHEGLAIVMVGSKTMVIDEKGRTVFEPELRPMAPYFSDGLISVCVPVGYACGSIGYLDKHGRIAIKPQFRIAFPFSEGRASVNVDEKWGFIDKAGRAVITPQFRQATSFANGLARVYMIDNGSPLRGPGWSYIDKNGKEVLDHKLRDAQTFKNGFAALKKDDGNWTVIDKTGKIVFNPQFDTDQYHVVEAPEVGDGLIRIWTKGPWPKWGYADLTGRIVIPPQFYWTENFSEGRAAVQAGSGGKFGYIDRTGAIVIKPQFDRAHKFMRGIARVEIGRYINPNPCRGGYNIICAESFIWDAEMGYIDQTGKYIWKPTK